MAAGVAEQMCRLKIPGWLLAIAEDSRIVHTENLAVPGGKVPVQQTPFFMASSARSLTALVVMQLVATGEAELDALVQWYPEISSWKSGEITVLNLLFPKTLYEDKTSLEPPNILFRCANLTNAVLGAAWAGILVQVHRSHMANLPLAGRGLWSDTAACGNA